MMFGLDKNLLVGDGTATIVKSFLSLEDSDKFYNILKQEIDWQQSPIKMFGKLIDQPRLTAFYGAPGIQYKYSGVSLNALPWSNTLETIKTAIEKQTKNKFNALLMNLYRDGSDYMGYHTDDEKELCRHSPIASLSLGATRKFAFKHKTDTNLKVELQLEHGDLLLMSYEAQKHWKHALPKTKKILAPRINLTFRKIMT